MSQHGKIIHITGDARKILSQIADAIRFREVVEKMRLAENVVLVLQDEERDETFMQMCHNIVTDEGDKYYAQKGAGEAPTTTFTAGGFRLGTGAGAPAKGSTDCSTFFGTAVAVAAGYPKTADADASNTGALTDAVSWKGDWTTAQNNGSAMTNGAIVDNTAAPTKALCHFTFTSFTKLVSQTLAVFVNHRMNGV